MFTMKRWIALCFSGPNSSSWYFLVSSSWYFQGRCHPFQSRIRMCMQHQELKQAAHSAKPHAGPLPTSCDEHAVHAASASPNAVFGASRPRGGGAAANQAAHCSRPPCLSRRTSGPRGPQPPHRLGGRRARIRGHGDRRPRAGAEPPRGQGARAWVRPAESRSCFRRQRQTPTRTDGGSPGREGGKRIPRRAPCRFYRLCAAAVSNPSARCRPSSSLCCACCAGRQASFPRAACRSLPRRGPREPRQRARRAAGGRGGRWPGEVAPCKDRGRRFRLGRLGPWPGCTGPAGGPAPL